MLVFIASALLATSQIPSQTAADRAVAQAEADAAIAEVTASEATDDAAIGTSDAMFDALMGYGADGSHSSCVPATAAEAQLKRYHEQVLAAVQLLRLERRDQPSNSRLGVMDDLLTDDGEMTLGRYAVQVIAQEACKG